MSLNRSDLARLVQNLLTSGVEDNNDTELIRKIVILNVLTLAGFVNLAPLAFVGLSKGNLLLFIVDLGAALILAGNAWYLRRTRNVAYVANCGMSLMAGLFLFLFVTGGVNNTGHLWFYTFPLFASFLLGSTRGAVATLMLLAVVVLFLGLPGNLPFMANYSADFKLRFIPSILVVMACAYVFESIREKNQRTLSIKNHELTETVGELKRTEAALLRTRDHLEERVEQRTSELLSANRQLKQEIEDRIKAEQAFHESYHTLVTVLESIDAHVYVADLTKHEILFVNKHVTDSLKGDLLGKTCYEVLRGESSPCDNCRDFENGVREGLPDSASVSQYQNVIDGRWYMNYERDIKWLDGRLVRLQVATDITDYKKTVEERDDLSKQLLQSQKMEAVGTLAGGIAHDFNNLLQAIHGNAELLLLELKNSEPGYQELTEIMRAAKRGGELTRQLLAYSRKIDSNLQLTELNRAVQNLTSLVERTIPRMIQLEFQLAESLPLVNADSSQIEQVLMNLVVNARDAMPDAGTLSIKTERVELDEDYNRIHPEVAPGEYVSLAVSDNGRGMDADTQSRIFDPFFTTKEVGKGTGLGLAMVFGIVKSHGGHITCESEPGEGTTFKIYLPAAAVGSETAQDAEPERSEGGSETILVVDDEATLRNFSRQLLKRFGYTVLCVEDGENALHLFEQERDRIDLVILDLIMPGMGGRRCLKKILEIDPTARVIIASGYSTRGPETQEVVEGAVSFIKKPFAIPEMLKAIRQALGATPLGPA